MVAVAALPVQEPDDPLILPVTLPVNDPMNDEEVNVPDTVSSPVIANVPPEGIIELMVEEETIDP